MTTLVNVGDTLAGKYKVDRILGIGGMGMVVAATHLELDQRVAIKFMLPDALANEQAMGRFIREAKAAVKLKSEHICRVLDVGKLDTGAPYIVMELMDGEDFAQVIRRRGPLPIADAVDLLMQSLEGLADAHANQIVHRDLKPGNLFVTSDNDGSPLVKVLDFGISKSQVGGQATKTGEIMGSPAYMSPEQMASAKNVDARADIWAVGVILYQAITGRMPFESDTLPGLCMAVLNETPPAPAQVRADLPPQLSAVVMRCLEKRPEGRFGNVAELAATLAPFGTPEAAASSRRITKVLGKGTKSTPALGNYAQTVAPQDPLTAPTQHGTGASAHALGIGSNASLSTPQMPGRISTLQASASEISFAQPAPKRRSGVVIGVVASVLVIGGIAVAVAVGSGGGKKAETVVAKPDPVETKPEVKPETKPVVEAKPEVKPEIKPAEPTVAKLAAIDIEPAAAAAIAKITVNKKPFTGPLELALDPDGTRSVVVTVTASGYVDVTQTIDLKAGDNPVTITLAKHGQPKPLTVVKSNEKGVPTKPAETKPVETKPVETKPAETKPVETKPAETKPTNPDEIWTHMQHDKGSK